MLYLLHDLYMCYCIFVMLKCYLCSRPSRPAFDVSLSPICLSFFANIPPGIVFFQCFFLSFLSPLSSSLIFPAVFHILHELSFFSLTYNNKDNRQCSVNTVSKALFTVVHMPFLNQCPLFLPTEYKIHQGPSACHSLIHSPFFSFSKFLTSSLILLSML